MSIDSGEWCEPPPEAAVAVRDSRLFEQPRRAHVQHALAVDHVGGVQHRLRRLRGDLRRQCVIGHDGFGVLPATAFEGCKAHGGISHHIRHRSPADMLMLGGLSSVKE